MNRTFWNIYLVGSGPSWQLDVNQIPAPNADTEFPFTSTQIKTQLADGSNAFVQPETKYIREIIRFTWVELTLAEAQVILDYLTDGEVIRIEDHEGNFYIGKFVRVNEVWLVGKVGTYDLVGEFETMPSPVESG